VAGVGQDLFIGRMAAHATGVGYPPPDQSQEEWQQVTTTGMLGVLGLDSVVAHENIEYFTSRRVSGRSATDRFILGHQYV